MKKMQVLAMMALFSVGLVNLAASQTYAFSYGQQTASITVDLDTITFEGFYKAVYDAIYAANKMTVQFVVTEDKTISEQPNLILNSDNFKTLPSSYYTNDGPLPVFSMQLVNQSESISGTLPPEGNGGVVGTAVEVSGVTQ